MLGRFKLGAVIGSGAMGTVFTATDPDLGRTVAVKVLHDEHARPRLLREAKAMARLSHPNVVPVHEIGTGEPVFIVMELVGGGTVRQWLAEPRSLAEITAVFEQAGRGLAAAHAAGLVHRDFKPENILRGDDGRVRVVDFGLVANRGEREEPAVSDGSPLDLALTHTGLVLGTPAYMAPEQHRGEVADARSDQFGFAVAFYEALYGERPFAGTTYREMVRNVYAGKVRPPREDRAVPPQVRAALLRALSVNPAERYSSLDALLDEVTRPPAPAPAPAVDPVRPPARGSTRWIAAAIAVLAIAGAAVFAATRGGDDTSHASESRASTTSRPPPSAPVPTPTEVARPGAPLAKPPAQPAQALATPTDKKPVAARKPRIAAPPPATAPAPAPAPTVDDAAERRRKQLELTE